MSRDTPSDIRSYPCTMPGCRDGRVVINPTRAVLVPTGRSTARTAYPCTIATCGRLYFRAGRGIELAKDEQGCAIYLRSQQMVVRGQLLRPRTH